MENFATVAVAFITGVIGPIAVLYIKHILDSRKKKPDMVMDTLRVSELINQKIDHIKEEFKADRVWISQFHNGGNFYPTGKSIAKFSIMYEVVSQNTLQKNVGVNQLICLQSKQSKINLLVFFLLNTPRKKQNWIWNQ